VLSFVRQVRAKGVATAVESPPPRIGISWAFQHEHFPEQLNETQAVEYLLAVHGVSVSGTTLGNRAKNDPTLKAGKYFLRDRLSQAAKAGGFEHENMDRKRR